MMLANNDESTMWKFRYFIKLYWKILLMIVWPLILLFLFIVYDNSQESRCGYVVLLMVGYWVTQCLPLGMTSLLPLLLFPCLGILSIRDTGACYINDATMILIGGFILATAIEDSNLHMRIALKVIQVFSYNHYSLLSGVILVTFLLSMWITSTAATFMMMPIIFDVLGELEREGLGNVFVNTESLGNPNSQPKPSKLTTTYLMGTAYAAIFGGSSTLVGSPSNLAFKGIFEKIFLCGPKIGFGQWMMFAVPLSLLNLCFTWIYVVSFLFFATLPTNDQNAQSYTAMKGQIRNVIKRVMKAKSDSLGKMTSHELGVVIMFVLFVILLVTREPGFMPGWTSILPGKEIPYSAPILLVSVLMFLTPKDLDFLYVWANDPNKRPKTSSEGLVTLKSIETRMPWSLMFLLGAGVAVSDGMAKSFLARNLDDAIEPLLGDENWSLLLYEVLAIVGVVTNITPDVVTANIVLPFLASVSTFTSVNPLSFMVTGALMCSYSFFSSFGSPPLAVIRNAGRATVKSLILRGLGPAIISYMLLPNLYVLFGSDYVYHKGIQRLFWSNKNFITESHLSTTTCDQLSRTDP
ncbi:protein I'm not dead yet-like [Copidosoma floridanum]|uniref:protein I'm not dead yet-like n=1 Tax=Copidosoma floridanum TaxID=29053 RepID=UPI0006C9BD1D|nr:protein I'm not dead yet-like [Copidosoma floridanum]